MSQTINKDKKIIILSIAAAVATVIAGIMHLMMVQRSISDEVGEGVLFLVGGILQIFWAVPVIRQWGKIWQIIGIVGTIIFTALWFGTHTHNLLSSTANMPQGIPHENPPSGGFTQGNATGEHFPRGPPPRGLASIPQIEYFQIAFIVLYATLSAKISKRK